jgi:hypothetical protein
MRGALTRKAPMRCASSDRSLPVQSSVRLGLGPSSSLARAARQTSVPCQPVSPRCHADLRSLSACEPKVPRRPQLAFVPSWTRAGTTNASGPRWSLGTDTSTQWMRPEEAIVESPDTVDPSRGPISLSVVTFFLCKSTPFAFSPKGSSFPIKNDGIIFWLTSVDVIYLDPQLNGIQCSKRGSRKLLRA